MSCSFILEFGVSAHARLKIGTSIGAEMLKDFMAKQQMPFRYVLVGSVCTTNPDFIEAVESLIGAHYLEQVPEDPPCWHNPHIMTCLLTHYFLWHPKIKLEKNS